MPTPPGKTWVEVSRAALASNARALKGATAKGTKFMAVVKSNAYGHGLPETVRAVRAVADWFGVDSVTEADEAARLSKKPVLVLGFVPDDERAKAVKAGHRMVAYDLRVVRRLSKLASRKRPARVHVKVETGTSRQGVPAKELPAFVRAVKKLPNVVVEGVSTHFANIEDTSDPAYAMLQLSRYHDALEVFAAADMAPELRHTACSAAVVLYPETHFDLVRGGVSLYGLWSSEETRRSARKRRSPVELRPALTWKTVIAQVKRLPKGTPVSYGLTEKVARDATVAVLPIGYWDGFDRGLSSKAHVLVRGKRAKVLGRVCMNMTVVDVTGIPGVREEDEVVLLGRQKDDEITAEETAAHIDTINYEVVTRINPRITRILVR